MTAPRHALERSAAVIASGKRWLCEDWECPAHRSCARHFGRSDAYAAMSEKHAPLVIPVVTDRDADDRVLIEPARLPEADSCEFYERDGFKLWLVTVGNGRQNVETPPGWMVLEAKA